MRKIVTAIIIAPLILVGGLTAANAQPADGSDRDTYTRNAQDKIHDWQGKVDDFTARTTAKGQHVATKAEDGLQTAWSNTKTEGRKLQTVGATGWDAAKSSFEKASRDMSDAWDKVKPRDN